MKILAVLAVATITGCANYQPPPVAMMAMPNDCANIEAHERWMETQSRIAQENRHDQIRSQFRHRLWTIRYNCRGV